MAGLAGGTEIQALDAAQPCQYPIQERQDLPRERSV
jgi:hypothetical protein